VLSFVITSGVFSINVPELQVARNDTQSVVVTYTRRSSAAVIDTLTILSDSPGQNLIYVSLGADETPTDTRSARITLVQTEGSGSPVLGDTIRVALFVSPEQDPIRGVEVFLGFDNTRLQTLGVDGPFERIGLTKGVDLQVNEIEGVGSADASAHISVFFPEEQKLADTLVVVEFVPIEEIQEQARIRVLSENPLRKSNFLSPANFSFGIHATNVLTLANSSPTVTPLSVIAFEEDTELTIDLTGLAFDLETAELDLAWHFEDNDSLFAFQVETVAGALSARITPPENAFGVFALPAIVSDAGGASDTVVLILDIKPTNDPPEVPVYIGPDDNNEELGSSVELTWSGMDREGDALTFEVHLGTTTTNIPIVANNLTNGSFLVEGLVASKTYFWMIVAADASGARTPGPIRRFSTASDVTLKPKIKFGDFDGNFIIEFSDFVVFANTFNTSTGDTAFDERADFDSSGTIDFSDFISFTQVFGTTLTKRISF